MSDKGCSQKTCSVLPDCYNTDPDCELRGLLREYAYLLDDLVFCIDFPGTDPCVGRRRSKRTQAQAVQDALDVKEMLQTHSRRR